MLIKTMKLRLDELFLYAAVDLVGFLFGILVLVLMTYFEGGEPDYTVFRMGTVMSCIFFCFVSVMMGMFGMGGYFNWHVGFGKTRKSFFLCDVATEFCWNFINLMIIWGLSFVEDGIIKLFFSSYREESKILWGMFGWMIPFFALFMTVIREITGTLKMRFGNKVFWIIWGIWMFICMVPVKIGENKSGKAAEMIEGITAWVKGVSVTGWVLMGTALVILLLAVSWLLMRKQMVKS